MFRFDPFSMKYQLVLQWPAASIKEYNTLIEIEDVLTEKLSANSEVDGHDAGSSEMNIFIRTDNPEASFNEIKSTIGSRDFWIDARVAYREVTKNEYFILWPQGLAEFKVT
jgi:hypothetical protein